MLHMASACSSREDWEALSQLTIRWLSIIAGDVDGVFVANGCPLSRACSFTWHRSKSNVQIVCGHLLVCCCVSSVCH